MSNGVECEEDGGAPKSRLEAKVGGRAMRNAGWQGKVGDGVRVFPFVT